MTKWTPKLARLLVPAETSHIAEQTKEEHKAGEEHVRRILTHLHIFFKAKKNL